MNAALFLLIVARPPADDVPANALTLDGEPLTLDGEPLTLEDT